MDITPGKPIRTYDKNGNWRDWSNDEIVGQKLNFYRWWKCGAGVDNLFIDMDGQIWSATCRAGGLLGNVWKDFNVPSEWISCPMEACTCGADLFVPKSKTRDEKSLLRRTQNLPTEFDKRNNDLVEFVAMERTHASNRKQVYWEIGRRCNYDCGYCWSWIHNNYEPHKPLDQLMKAIHLIEEKFIKGEKVNFIISGGEPTANKDFLPWLRYLDSCGHHVSLHSNGSRLPDYYKEIIHYGDLNLSVHFDFYNKEKFVKVVQAVVEEKVSNKNQGVGHLEVKFMVPPHNIKDALELEEDLKAIPEFVNYCTWAFVPIRGSLNNKNVLREHATEAEDRVMEGYTEEDYKLFGSRK